MMLRVDIVGSVGSQTIEARFDTRQGVTALFGRSGAGKSTIINMIAGLIEPRSGRITLGDRVLFDSDGGVNVAVERRRIGYVFQEHRLFPHLSVRANLTYGRWAGRASRVRSLGEIVSLLELEDLLGRRPATLSGGEKQRVAIGRALLADPQALLMDEPLASLDAAHKDEILPYLDRLRREARIPIVYVSHDLDEVARFARELVIVSHGVTLAGGPVAQVMSRLDLGPATGRHEAGSVLTGTIANHDDHWGLSEVRIDGQTVTVARLDDDVGTQVRLRIRASEVSLATHGLDDISIRNQLSGEILEIREQEGAYAELLIKVGAQVLRARVTRKSAREMKLATGQPIVALVKSMALQRRSIGAAHI
jgi:molybdate transport system ATP-binding protein